MTDMTNSDGYNTPAFEGIRARVGQDESRILQYATEAIETVDPADLELDRADSHGLWRLRRHAHDVVRDSCEIEGLTSFDCLEIMGHVRRVVSEERFVDHVLAQLEEGANG